MRFGLEANVPGNTVFQGCNNIKKNKKNTVSVYKVKHYFEGNFVAKILG